MGSGMSWTKCTELALVETTRLGFLTFSRPRSLATMNQDFWSMELFSVAHGVAKGFQGSELFQIFPEAQRVLLAWVRNNLEQLNSEMARKHLLAEVIPHCQTIYNEEREQHGFQPLEPAEFMKFVRLKTMDVTTA
jgi:hypothetical protein